MKNMSIWNPFHGDLNKSDFFSNFFGNLDFSNMEFQVDKEGRLNVSVDVPGVKEADLTIELSDNILTVKGERRTATSVGTVHKTFSIPEGYNQDSISAELKDGVLSLVLLPKTPVQKETKKIALKAK